jgi:hypothetical protein
MVITDEERAETAGRPDSLPRLLAFWLLVGFSLFGLGWDVADALGPTVPLSGMGAGLLFGTVVVAVLWIAGVRPPLLASLGYFLAQPLLALGLSLTLPALGITVEGWAAVAVRAASIALAALLAFGVPWGRVRRRVEGYVNPAAFETGS